MSCQSILKRFKFFNHEKVNPNLQKHFGDTHGYTFCFLQKRTGPASKSSADQPKGVFAEKPSTGYLFSRYNERKASKTRDLSFSKQAEF